MERLTDVDVETLSTADHKLYITYNNMDVLVQRPNSHEAKNFGSAHKVIQALATEVLERRKERH
jgi:hypothetical protein